MKILVIEDEVNIRRLMRVNLAASGHRVTVAAAGEDGLRLVREDTPELILLDLRMPGISGWDVIRQLKAAPEYRAIPVIVVTASARPSEEALILASGAAGYLPKPFTVTQLTEKIEQVIGV
jgi:two-component system, OmpR family, phosphate regulon response regulator PhoB